MAAGPIRPTTHGCGPGRGAAFEDAAPHATGSGYVNFLTEDEGERVAASYGANYARLQTLKQRFDPENLFRMNLNIPPADGKRASASP